MMSTQQQKKEKQRSLMHSVKHSLRNIRTSKVDKGNLKRNLTPPSSIEKSSQSAPNSRKSSFISFRKDKMKKPKNPTISHSPTIPLTAKRVFKPSKSSTKYQLPINVPSLFMNLKPDKFGENSFNHLSALDKAIIPISIDIEPVYNEIYDNNYNRKVLGPIQSVQFPLIIDCVSNSVHHSHSYTESFLFSQNEEEEVPKFRHQKSASMCAPLLNVMDITRSRGRTVNVSKRRREYFHRIETASTKVEKKIKIGDKIITENKVNLTFEDKYAKRNDITADELEILARSLLNCQDNDSSLANNRLLQSAVKKKAESVSFGLQLINSIKQITSTLTRLMETFSDGLIDLLAICGEFMELMIDPLPRSVHNDYGDIIFKYRALLQIMNEMSINFDKSSTKLRDNVPIIRDVLGSDINNRICEYESYFNDMKAGDHDVKSLQIHCDRTLRRLFREIPLPQFASAPSEPQLKRKKSLKQHKNIRVFGTHYVSSNSNEYICRSVPSAVRSCIISDYIHYLTLLDTMNVNTKRCYNQILPKLNDEFRESQKQLSLYIANALQNINENVVKYNAKSNVQIKAFRAKPLAPVKSYSIHKNVLMASPMHTYNVIANINEYVNEESEKKTYDEFEMVKVQKKNFNKQKKEENGKFSFKNYRMQFDSANFINEEVILSFFSNHYYHLGDIMYEIPALYQAFDNYLTIQLSKENLLFLTRIDDVYFNNSNQNSIIHETKDIYRHFICEDGKHQINLAGNIRKRIHKNLKQIDKIKDPLSIFDKAYDAISSLIHKESLPNFYKSLHFRKWYEKARQENEKLWKKEKKMMKK